MASQLDSQNQQQGGFLLPTLPSPPPSSQASTIGTRNILPSSRANPLKSGSAKESTLINYVDTKLLGISRRYEKRCDVEPEGFLKEEEDADGQGYHAFGAMAKDLEGVIDVVWTSGTPSLQIPYLLSIALRTCTSIPSFPFAPRPTFRLLNKLDLAFVSLLQGANVETDAPLPGSLNGKGKPSTTDKVRVRGIVEKTRVAVVEVAGRDLGSVTEVDTDFETDEDYDMATDNDDVGGPEDMQIDGNHGRWEMEIARVYERTLVELGITLETSTSGE